MPGSYLLALSNVILQYYFIKGAGQDILAYLCMSQHDAAPDFIYIYTADILKSPVKWGADETGVSLNID